MNLIEQKFFNNLEKKLWTAADKLLPNLRTAVYKHMVLGLIFPKYVSDGAEACGVAVERVVEVNR